VHVRRKFIVGNWKMNGSLAALKELAGIADAARQAPGADVAICPPFTLIAPAVTRASGAVRIGAQDCHARPSGPHTGNVSAAMLKEAGARLVIVGHSERRADQHEKDEDVSGKAEAALAAGLDVILCVGESEAQREAGDHVGVVIRQLAASFPRARGVAELVIAYEPIWAIGTGRTATPADVAEMHAAIRRALVDELAGASSGASVRIVYGGSVKADNAAELFAVPDVDGALVGGASLTSGQFVPIIEAAAAS
jgi:triosephosphate isomerase